jgi:hypothetical protein
MSAATPTTRLSLQLSQAGCLWLSYGAGFLSTLSTSPSPFPIVLRVVRSLYLSDHARPTQLV